MTSGVATRIRADKDRGVVLIDFLVEDPDQPDMTIEVPADKARGLADWLYRAANEADGGVAEA